MRDEALAVDSTLPEVDAGHTPSPSKKVSDAGSTSPDTGARDPEPEADAGTNPDPIPVDAGNPTNPGTATKPTQGQVLITEVMYNSSGLEPSSEWFELHNTTSSPKTLSGLTIVDGANRTHVIGLGVTIAANAYVVLVRNDTVADTAKVPAVATIYEYGANLPDDTGIQLANGGTGRLSLEDGSTVIAQASYGGWFTQGGGSSVQLKTLTYAASQQSSNWCLSSTPWAAGSDNGTPGAASDCP